MHNIQFDKIYYEKNTLNFPLGRKLLEKYNDLEKVEILSHNNIEELRKYENKDFPKLKRYLIIGTRKNHKYTPNHKISDYLVPFTSSGCYAMCMYCYLVCNYNKCAYLRVFVNTKEMLDRLITFSNKSEEELCFEIGSNSDLLLENLVTNQLQNNIEYFLNNTDKGILTFPTKFKYIAPLLNIKDKRRIIPRMSLNPQRIISKVEFKTSNLKDRCDAINKLVDVGYKPYILVAPVIITDDFEKNYSDLVKYMKEHLSYKAQHKITFEVIFMTYSYIHTKINEQAFPNAIKLYNKEIMASRGIGKYHYKNDIKQKAKVFIESLLKRNFNDCVIKYIV